MSAPNFGSHLFQVCFFCFFLSKQFFKDKFRTIWNVLGNACYFVKKKTNENELTFKTSWSVHAFFDAHRAVLFGEFELRPAAFEGWIRAAAAGRRRFAMSARVARLRSRQVLRIPCAPSHQSSRSFFHEWQRQFASKDRKSISGQVRQSESGVGRLSCIELIIIALCSGGKT